MRPCRNAMSLNLINCTIQMRKRMLIDLFLCLLPMIYPFILPINNYSFWQWPYNERCSMWETLHIMKWVLLAIYTCKEALLRASPMEATYVAVKGHYVLSSPGCETWKLLTWKVELEISNFDCVSLCMLTRLRWIIVVSLLLCQNKML